MKNILLWIIFSKFLFASIIVDTKDFNGITYNIVKAKATIMHKYDGKGKDQGKDLVFDNLNGEFSISDVSQIELSPYNIDDSIDVYYAVKKDETLKRMYRVFFEKKDVKLNQVPVYDDIGFSENLSIEKISTIPTHSVVSKSPLLKLIYKDDKYQYIKVGSTIIIYLAIGFILFVMYLFIKSGSILGVVIGIFMLAFFYLFSAMTGEEVSMFDMGKKEFYKGSSIEKSREFGNKYAKFDNIYGFQILKNHECDMVGHNNDIEECYDLFSLNVVLKNRHRINLLSHGQYTQIRDDADKLSTALNKPILDQINIKR